jgi:cell division protein FtsW
VVKKTNFFPPAERKKIEDRFNNRINRVLNFNIFPETEAEAKKRRSDALQENLSYMAIANGGAALWGRGPGHGQMHNHLSQSENDFIYAIIIEQTGVIGAITILFLYLLFFERGMAAIRQSGRFFGGLLSAGLSTLIVTQAFVNMLVATGLMPVTGQPLPLVSKGGTSLWIMSLAIGIILRVSSGEDEAKIPRYVRR